MNNNIKINKIQNGNLTNDNFRHLYQIHLEKNKSYFINLMSKNNFEFNLRLYDSSKNIIKFKDDNDENIDIADLNIDLNQLNLKNTLDIEDEYKDEDEEFEDVIISESIINFNDENFEDIITSILESSLVNMDELKDKNIEIVIEIDDSEFDYPNNDQINNFLEKKKLNNEIIINFNNKLYFTPEKSDNYIISVSSDYNNQEGEYSLLVQEVENLKFILGKKINLNEDININFKKKFQNKKFHINLNKNETYKINSNGNIKLLVSRNDQKIISKDNTLEFSPDYDGTYEIDIVSLEAKQDININVSKCKKKLKNDIIKTRKIVLLDDNDIEYELTIINGELNIKK